MADTTVEFGLLIGTSGPVCDYKAGDVIFREGDPALVALFGMMRVGDLPERFRDKTWTEPDLTIRTRTGEIHPEYSAVKLAIGFPP